MKRIFQLLLVLSMLDAAAQTNTKNYVKTASARQAFSAGTNIINNSLYTQTQQRVVYLDGLGRNEQSIIRWGSSTQADLVTFNQYDNNGNLTRNYLAYRANQSNANFRSDASNEQLASYNSRFGTYDGNYAFSEHDIEKSPLRRVLRQGAPGSDWSLNSSNTIKTHYLLNDASDEVKYWKWSDEEIINANSLYGPGELYKIETEDEDGNKTVTFTNKQGNTILKKSQIDANNWASTYYIYDELNNLRIVLPPQSNEEIEQYYGASTIDGYEFKMDDHNINSGTVSPKIAYSIDVTITISGNVTLTPDTHIKPLEILTDDFLTTWAFQYSYDERNRMIMKQVPGADPVYMVYDNWDRLVLTQDGNLRNENKWLFTSYDALNRPVLTGLVSDNRSQAALQTFLMNLTSTSRYLSYTGSGINHGYSSEAYPFMTGSGSTVSDILTVTYYDNYGFVGEMDKLSSTSYSAPTAFTQNTDAFHLAPNEITQAKGLVTGTKTRELGEADFIQSITYYDEKYRPLQVISNDHLDADIIMSNQYDFVGNLKRSQSQRSKDGNIITIHRRYDYDHLNRLVNVFHKVNDDAEVLISHNEYNEIGELIQKKIHAEGVGISPNSNTNYQQVIDYDYNIRGWLTRMNDAQLSDQDDLFGMELYYNTNSVVGSNVLYNGNISAMKWCDVSGDPADDYQSYNFSYDKLNRLLSADYRKNTNNISNFDVNNLQYDKNGNILNLARNGDGSFDIDDLQYSYIGNQLTSVNDLSGHSEGFDNKTTGTNVDYAYDDNGNMIADANKGITSITYNYLNLPELVTFNTNKQISYLYDAAGIKLRQQVIDGGSIIKTTDYIGEFIYVDEHDGEGSKLELIQHEEGRLIPTNNPGATNGLTYDYQYHLKDHLGNVRLTFGTTPQTYTMVEDFETGQDNGFQNLNRHTNSIANTSVGGDEVELLQTSFDNGSQIVGAMVFLHLNVGDRIDLSVNASYVDEPYDNAMSPLDATTLFNLFSSNYVGVPEGVSIAYENEFSEALLRPIPVEGTPDNTPQAFLNYIIFDEDMNFVTSGFKQISSAAHVSGTTVGEHEVVSITNIQSEINGYIFAYLSNENESPSIVNFDDFTVTQSEGNNVIMSTQDYYPFGLTFNEYQRTASTPNKYKYNGKELQEETGWLDYGARMYQPELGRWSVTDPLAGLYKSISPYHYALNNPISNIDPNGMNSVNITELFNEAPDGVSSYDGDGNCTCGCDGTPPCKEENNALLGPQGAVVGKIVQETVSKINWFIRFSPLVFLSLSGDSPSGSDRDRWEFERLSRKSLRDLTSKEKARLEELRQFFTFDSNGNVIDKPFGIHPGKQGKHIEGHNNYIPGRSTIVVDADNLLNDFNSGNFKKSEKINDTKTRVEFHRQIGYYYDPETGHKVPTRNAIIHTNKHGSHFVPSRPSNEK